MFCILPILGLALGAEPAPISLAGDFGEPRVIVAAPKDPRFAHLSWPKVVKTGDETLVVAYIAGRFHGNHGEGCPAVSVSTDGGKSFSRPNVLKTYGPKDAYTCAGNVALGVTPGGAVSLLSMAYKADEANTIDGWRSIDSGKTWLSADVSRLAENKTGSVYGHVFSTADRNLAVVGHFRKGSTTRPAGLWISRSADDGKSWADPETITTTPMVEPAFVQAGDRIVGLARPRNTPGWYAQLVSGDAGKTWEVKQKGLVVGEAASVQLPSPGLFVDPNDPTRLLALVSQRFPSGGNKELYAQIDLYAADVKTLDWKRVGAVARFPRGLKDRDDATYGWMTHLKDRTWYLVFYCGRKQGANDIYGLQFEVPASK